MSEGWGESKILRGFQIAVRRSSFHGGGEERGGETAASSVCGLLLSQPPPPTPRLCLFMCLPPQHCVLFARHLPLMRFGVRYPRLFERRRHTPPSQVSGATPSVTPPHPSEAVSGGELD